MNHTRHLILIIILFGALITSSSVYANGGLADAPQPKFLNNYKNTGQSTYQGPQTNNTKWKYQTEDVISSSPTIGHDGTVYFGSWDHKLYALNPNGQKKCSLDLGNKIFPSPTIGKDGTIYVGTDTFYAIKDGKVKWTYSMGSWVTFATIGSSAALAPDGTIYVGANCLYALNSDGKLKWTFFSPDASVELDCILSTPAIGNDGTIYFGWDKLYALKTTGKLKWANNLGLSKGKYLDSSPAIGTDGTIYCGSLDHKLYALTPQGQKKWTFQATDEIYSSPAIGKDGTIYFGDFGSYFYALRPDGSLKWKYKTGDSIYSSAALGSDGTIYFGSDKFYALTPTGKLKWTYKTKYYIDSSPAIGKDGTIYFADADYDSYHGTLYAIQDPILIRLNNPSHAQSGGSMAIQNYVYNQGDKRLDNIILKFYLSINTNLTGKKYYLGQRIIKSLLPGHKNSSNTLIKIPLNLTPNYYYVAAMANQISTISSTKLKVTTPGSIEKERNHQRTVEMKNTGLSIISLILSIILISGGLLIKKI